jgi:capsular polysaccharide biosynthesis protein
MGSASSMAEVGPLPSRSGKWQQDRLLTMIQDAAVGGDSRESGEWEIGMAAPNEGEVELLWFLKAVIHNWWVVVAATLIGLLAGAVLTVFTPKTYDSTASVYIGQSTDANGDPMPGLDSNARAAVQLATSDAVLQEAVKQVGDGLTASALLSGLSVVAPTQVVTATTGVDFVTITVSDTKARRAAAAANALAAVLIERIGSGTATKLHLLQQQTASDETQLAVLQGRSNKAEMALQAIARSKTSAQEKSLQSVPWANLEESMASERASVLPDLQNDQLEVVVAKEAEQARVLNEAVPADSPGSPSFRLDGAVGVLAGLVVGLVLALLRQRLRSSDSAPA